MSSIPSTARERRSPPAAFINRRRSIPSLVDGLTPDQRKVLYAWFNRNDERPISVGRLATIVAQYSPHRNLEYRCKTIINLAQNYVGSNNINLLMPHGMFGTRLNGGTDAADPNNIKTTLNPLARRIFHPYDDPLLKHIYEDDIEMEPIFYIPVLPLLLINGAEVIKPSRSTKIPNYRPKDIIANLRRMLDSEEPVTMLPWYKGYRGTIESIGDQQYLIKGEIDVLSDNEVKITELPIGTWTQEYIKNVLEPMLHGSANQDPVIQDYQNKSTVERVDILITLLPGKMANLQSQGLHTAFKLQTNMDTNMLVVNEFERVQTYQSVTCILKDFYKFRLKVYKKRKDYMEGLLQARVDKLTNEIRFILEMREGGRLQEVVGGVHSLKDKIETIAKAGYTPDPSKAWRILHSDGDKEEPNSILDDIEPELHQGFKNFQYLLDYSVLSLSSKLENKSRRKNKDEDELRILKSSTPEDLWRNDLNELELNSSDFFD